MFNNGDTRSGRMTPTKSKDYEGGDEDMFVFTMRVREMFKCNFHEYANYPFDKLDFIYRFELSHFELVNKENKKKTYRFDHYIDD